MSATNAPAPEQLERGELVYLEKAPFALPEGEDLAFLLQQRSGSLRRKHIGFDPHSGALNGFSHPDRERAERVLRLLSAFSRGVSAWLAEALPAYRGGVEADR